jgi:hypothetical protein
MVFVMLYKVYSALCILYSESGESTWSSANNSVLSVVSSCVSFLFQCITISFIHMLNNNGAKRAYISYSLTYTSRTVILAFNFVITELLY